MEVDWQLIVDLINVVIWPLVVALALILLRRPLAELVAQIARRARKLSVYNVSVELDILPELSASWTIGSEDVRQLTPSQIFDSASWTLFQELLKPGKADYAVVDLGKGQEWLTSRLYIFALILGEVRGLRAFVFLETVGGTRRKFLGVATPTDIRRGLSAHYPWLEQAYFLAAAAQCPVLQPDAQGVSMLSDQPPLFSGVDDSRITQFVRSFLETIQRTTEPPPEERDSYQEIGTQSQQWERCHWIDGERLERDLAGYLKDDDYQDSVDKPRSDVIEATLRRRADFVGLVKGNGRFVGLVDRNALLDRVWKESEADKIKTRESDST